MKFYPLALGEIEDNLKVCQTRLKIAGAWRKIENVHAMLNLKIGRLDDLIGKLTGILIKLLLRKNCQQFFYTLLETLISFLLATLLMILLC
ncbi:hypothetical protein NEOC65_001142 [Neochlamydia sp. AcF65]|nr:hypothetical protein [Neochlamydia sp. AcF65]